MHASGGTSFVLVLLSCSLALADVITVADWTSHPTGQDGSEFGHAVSGAGDIDGDGIQDLLVGAPRWDGDELSEGRVYLYFGSARGPSDTADWTEDPVDWQDGHFGTDVARAFDVDGQGYGDFLVGAPGWSFWRYGQEGSTYLYVSADGEGVDFGWQVDPTDLFQSWFGSAVSSAGDVNADGYADVLVGASGMDGEEAGEGRAYLWLGNRGSPGTTPDWTADPTDQSGAAFGFDVAGGGDVDGDGFDDVVVTAGYADGDVGFEGRAYLYLGQSTVLGADPLTGPVWIADPSDEQLAYFGATAAFAGDVDQDGYDDVLVGAPRSDGEAVDEGRVYLFRGGDGGLEDTPSWTADPTDQEGAGFGYALDGAGDVNADGYPDLVIGAPWFDGEVENEGRVYIYLGGPDGLVAEPAAVIDLHGSDHSNVGSAVAGAGDVNGDGVDDLLVGAYGWDGDVQNEGAAFLFYGAACLGSTEGDGCGNPDPCEADPTDPRCVDAGTDAAVDAAVDASFDVEEAAAVDAGPSEARSRGCACEIAGQNEEREDAWLVWIVALSWLSRLRRGRYQRLGELPRSRHEHSARLEGRQRHRSACPPPRVS